MDQVPDVLLVACQPLLTEQPGRSAASLLEDLILYDPRQATKDDYHLLEDGPKGADRAQYIGQLLPEASCLHDFCLKPRQSLLPALDEIAGSETIWQAAAICRNCRLHLLLKVDYSVAYQTEPCPRWESPLHHLVRSSWREEAWTRDLANDGNCMDEIHVYECSSRTCSAIVSIQLSTPIFTDEALRHLVDRDLLNARAKAAFEQKKGQTDGMKWPLPIDVLTDLQAYIRNAWRMEKNAEIDLNNKRFVVRFGPDGTACGGVLEMLGFELKVSFVLLVSLCTDWSSQANHGLYRNLITVTSCRSAIQTMSSWTTLKLS